VTVAAAAASSVPPRKTRLLAALISALARVICATVRTRILNEETLARAINAAPTSNGAILVTWHGRTLLPVYRFRGRGYWALISLSRDGELQAENFRRFGFRVIRGSTGRRGVAATREVIAALKDGGVLAFTPDGPRGPSHVAQPGVAYFAQRTGCPIIPVGISAHPRWLARSWDRYLIPKPFARACWVVADPIHVAPGQDLEEVARQIEAALNAAEAEAERQVGATPPPSA
jgi:hypothetical protein